MTAVKDSGESGMSAEGATQQKPHKSATQQCRSEA